MGVSLLCFPPRTAGIQVRKQRIETVSEKGQSTLLVCHSHHFIIY